MAAPQQQQLDPLAALSTKHPSATARAQAAQINLIQAREADLNLARAANERASAAYQVEVEAKVTARDAAQNLLAAAENELQQARENKSPEAPAKTAARDTAQAQLSKAQNDLTQARANVTAKDVAQNQVITAEKALRRTQDPKQGFAEAAALAYNHLQQQASNPVAGKRPPTTEELQSARVVADFSAYQVADNFYAHGGKDGFYEAINGGPAKKKNSTPGLADKPEKGPKNVAKWWGSSFDDARDPKEGPQIAVNQVEKLDLIERQILVGQGRLPKDALPPGEQALTFSPDLDQNISAEGMAIRALVGVQARKLQLRDILEGEHKLPKAVLDQLPPSLRYNASEADIQKAGFKVKGHSVVTERDDNGELILGKGGVPVFKVRRDEDFASRLKALKEAGKDALKDANGHFQTMEGKLAFGASYAAASAVKGIFDRIFPEHVETSEEALQVMSMSALATAKRCHAIDGDPANIPTPPTPPLDPTLDLTPPALPIPGLDAAADVVPPVPPIPQAEATAVVPPPPPVPGAEVTASPLPPAPPMPEQIMAQGEVPPTPPSLEAEGVEAPPKSNKIAAVTAAASATQSVVISVSKGPVSGTAKTLSPETPQVGNPTTDLAKVSKTLVSATSAQAIAPRNDKMVGDAPWKVPPLDAGNVAPPSFRTTVSGFPPKQGPEPLDGTIVVRGTIKVQGTQARPN